ncbi:MAG: FecR family protein, partial [Sulfuricella sp.]|nr:FecR family protein [Sulfuricella sp.]
MKRSVISASLLFACMGTAHAASVGRVLVSVGDTTAIRNSVVIKLATGAEVQSGDTLRVGEASNMQVRFIDEGIIALRANSAYRIDDYRFENKPGEDKAIFSLLKGGLRAITGAIARTSRDNYAVKAQAATIGIRGTHFVLAQCSSDCFNKDGSKAEDGLFGGVTDGRIAVTNQAGEKEFGKSEFFHVVSAITLPQPLLAPPSFLRDQLEGQAKTKGGKPPAGTAGEGKEAATKEASQQTGTAVTTQPAVTADVAPPIQKTLTTFVPSEQPPVQQASGLTTGQAFPYVHALARASAGADTDSSASGTFPYSFSWSSVDRGTVTITDSTKLVQSGDEAFAQILTSNTPLLAYLMTPLSINPVSFDWGSGFTGTVSWSKTASTNTGSDAAAGNLSWGRFTETSSGTFSTGLDAGQTFSSTSYEHWATGTPVSSLPTAGTYSYAWIGGTSPTDQYGNVGTMGAKGNVGVAFNPGGASVSLATTTWTMPSGTAYSLSFSNQPVTIGQSSYSTTTPGWTD